MADLSETRKAGNQRQTGGPPRLRRPPSRAPPHTHLLPLRRQIASTASSTQKPKRTAVTNLKRVRNILSNPNVALVIDHWQEEWQGLWYVLINGTADLLYEGPDHQQAIASLREKYPQYRTMDLDTNPVIRITPTNIIRWGHPSGIPC